MWLIAILVGIGVFAIALSVYHRELPGPAPYLHGTTIDYAEATAYWKQAIDRFGGTSAYAMFTRDARALTPGEAHEAAHAFGGALYEALGVDGLSVCDINFDYGCYHQFVGSAIIDKGLGSLTAMRDACFSAGMTLVQTGGCLHGMGHGMLGYLGYSFDNLKQALAICGSLDGNSPYSVCTDGVYMEYNLRILATTNSEATSSRIYDPRPLTDASRYEPCASLDAAFRPGCVFELPVWWFKTPGSPSPHDRAVLYGSYCAVYADEAERFPCFRGMGYM